MQPDLYIGLISGTSMDAIDAVLVAIDDRGCTLEASLSHAYPSSLHTRLTQLIDEHQHVALHEVGQLDIEVAREFAAAARSVMELAGVDARQVTAIGSHGQTVMHDPDSSAPFSMQLGDAANIAALAGVSVVANFRNGDIALGGQGAPLVPAFHRWAFADSTEHRAVVNIGGIANITALPTDGKMTGFDTGPGNVLLDQWCREHLHTRFDKNGAWGMGGTVDHALLKQLRSDKYFSRLPPKSTGTDYFNRAWLENYLSECTTPPDPQDIQATLGELTAGTIADARGPAKSIGICGGGAANADLLARLNRLLPGCTVESTSAWGIDPDWVEAMAFAWLAQQRINTRPGNVPDVTGARFEICLGGVYLAADD